MPYSARDWPDDFPRAVIYTRGAGFAELAELLATDTAVRSDADPAQSCLDQCADLAVMSRASSFTLVSTASPVDFDPARVRAVIGAVAGGPHSRLAAVLAARLGETLGVPAELLSGYRTKTGAGVAAAAVADATAASGLAGRIEAVASAGDLAATFQPGTLLVLGASGGSWLHRQFLSPGQKLTAAAGGGAVVVHSQPLRAFHRLTPIAGMSLHMRVADASLVAEHHVQAVVDGGKLVGVVREQSLQQADPTAEIGEIMEQAPLASAFDALGDLRGLEEFYEGAPILVVDKRGTLVGGVERDDLLGLDRAWPTRNDERGED
jgi:hypothetical protein